jgi:hypothetical protein
MSDQASGREATVDSNETAKEPTLRFAAQAGATTDPGGATNVPDSSRNHAATSKRTANAKAKGLMAAFTQSRIPSQVIQQLPQHQVPPGPLQIMDRGPSPQTRVALGFLVFCLVGLLIRLLQMRRKRVKEVALIYPQFNDLKRDNVALPDVTQWWWTFSLALCIILGSLGVFFIAYTSRQAKEEQHQSSLAWSITLGIVLLIGCLVLIEWSGLGPISAVTSSSDTSTTVIDLWVYLAVGIAGLALAKVLNEVVFGRAMPWQMVSNMFSSAALPFKSGKSTTGDNIFSDSAAHAKASSGESDEASKTLTKSKSGELSSAKSMESSSLF